MESTRCVLLSIPTTAFDTIRRLEAASVTVSPLFIVGLLEARLVFVKVEKSSAQYLICRCRGRVELIEVMPSMNSSLRVDSLAVFSLRLSMSSTRIGAE